MIVLGIGGLHNAIQVKRELWPHLSEREYSATQGREAAAALVIDGEVVAAAAEERFSRVKHDGDFPQRAIEYCLREAGIAPEQVDEVAHCYNYERARIGFSRTDLSQTLYRRVFSREALLEVMAARAPALLAAAEVHCINHHLAHAASAYFACGRESALVLVTDWMGEAESLTVWRGENGRLAPLHATSTKHSLGALYTLVTFHLGFSNHDEYKVMGLAPYGDPDRYRATFRELLRINPDGLIEIPLLGLCTSELDHQTYRPVLDALAQYLGPARLPGEPLDQVHMDVAAALQDRLGEALLHVASHWADQTGLEHLAMAGGVALNCSATGRLRRSGRFADIFVQPAASDDGAALGAALHRSSLHGAMPVSRFPPPYLGPGFQPGDCAAALARRQSDIAVTSFADDAAACAEAARRIAQGQVIAWYHGRMEFGPRALGNRSILADPRRPDIRDRVNRAVKKREGFRPFAPAVAAEDVHRVFEVEAGQAFPYMTEAALTRADHADQLPGITHVDGTARLQTVAAADNPRFHRLLKAFEEISGIPVLLNTSFNVNHQPVVNTPLEAIDTLLMTDIDALFLGNELVMPTVSDPAAIAAKEGEMVS